MGTACVCGQCVGTACVGTAVDLPAQRGPVTADPPHKPVKTTHRGLHGTLARQERPVPGCDIPAPCWRAASQAEGPEPWGQEPGSVKSACRHSQDAQRSWENSLVPVDAGSAGTLGPPGWAQGGWGSLSGGVCQGALGQISTGSEPSLPTRSTEGSGRLLFLPVCPSPPALRRLKGSRVSGVRLGPTLTTSCPGPRLADSRPSDLLASICTRAGWWDEPLCVCVHTRVRHTHMCLFLPLALLPRRTLVVTDLLEGMGRQSGAWLDTRAKCVNTPGRCSAGTSCRT